MNIVVLTTVLLIASTFVAGQDWTWQDGYEVTSDSWAPGMPIDNGGDCCVLMADGTLRNADCNEQRRVLCRYETARGEDFANYRYESSNVIENWFDAMNVCRDRLPAGATLVGFETAEDRNEAMQHFPGQVEDVWVGCSRGPLLSTEDPAPAVDNLVWTWQDGNPVTADSWAPGMPTDAGDCCVLGTDGTLQNADCNEPKRVLCRYLTASGVDYARYHYESSSAAMPWSEAMETCQTRQPNGATQVGIVTAEDRTEAIQHFPGPLTDAWVTCSRTQPSETPATEAPPVEEPVTDAPVDPVTDTESPDEIVTEEPFTDAPIDPVTDTEPSVEPVTEEPVTDAPVDPVTEEPISDAPVDPITDTEPPVEPVTEEPVTDAPVDPVTEEPITDAPVDPVTDTEPPVEPVTEPPVEAITDAPFVDDHGWTWQDGNPVTPDSWAPGMPVDNAGDCCVLRTDGNLQNVDCNQYKRVLCRYETARGVDYANYKYESSNEVMTWYDAMNVCQTRLPPGATLVGFETAEDRTEALQRFPGALAEVWVSCSRGQSAGQPISEAPPTEPPVEIAPVATPLPPVDTQGWTWQNGNPVTGDSWAPGMPTQDGGNCCVLRTNGLLQNVDCNQYNRALCRYETTRGVDYANYKYESNNEYMNWDEAMQLCRDRRPTGASLVDVETAEDRNEALQHFPGQVTDVWVGCSRPNLLQHIRPQQKATYRQDAPMVTNGDVCLESLTTHKDYYPDSADCHWYYQCFYVNATYAFGIRRQCAQGLFWHDLVLQCMPEGQTPCQDVCLDPAAQAKGCYAGTGCRQFFVCANTASYGMCCPSGSRFNVDECGCDTDTECQDNCVQVGPPATTAAPSVIINATTCQDPSGTTMASVPGMPNAYTLLDASGQAVLTMTCPATTAFNLETCRCDSDSNLAPTTQAPWRVPVFLATFDGDYADHSISHFRNFLQPDAQLDTTTYALGNGSLRVNHGYLQVPGLTNYDIGQTASFCAFFKCNGNSCEKGGILSNYKDENQFTIVMGVQTTNTFSARVRMWQPVGVQTVSAPITIPAYGWNYACVTYDGNSLKLYLNGNVADTQFVGSRLSTAQIPYEIGRDAVLGNFGGNIDDVRIAPFAMTKEEIDAIRQEVAQPQVAPTPAPVAGRQLPKQPKSKMSGVCNDGVTQCQFCTCSCPPPNRLCINSPVQQACNLRC